MFSSQSLGMRTCWLVVASQNFFRREPHTRPRCTYCGMGLRLLLCAALFVVSCEGVPASAGASASAKGLPSARVAPADPSRLPTSDQERAVTEALATAGVRG